MKKFFSLLVFLLVLFIGAIAVVFELYPDSAAHSFIKPWCGEVYCVARNKVVSAYFFVKEKVSCVSCCSKKDATLSCPEIDTVKKNVSARISTNVVSRLSEQEIKKSLEKKVVSLKDAKWYSNRRISQRELNGKISIVCVWNCLSPESVELLKNAQRISEGFRGKPLVVFASHRGGEKPSVKSVLKKADVVIPCCEGAGHPNEPKSVNSKPVFYMIDKAGKLRYYGRNDKVMTVKLVELLSE